MAEYVITTENAADLPESFVKENEIGVRCIAVSLKGYNGKSTYAISISAPKDRMSDARILLLREMILKTKHQIESNVY